MFDYAIDWDRTLLVTVWIPALLMICVFVVNIDEWFTRRMLRNWYRHPNHDSSFIHAEYDEANRGRRIVFGTGPWEVYHLIVGPSPYERFVYTVDTYKLDGTIYMRGNYIINLEDSATYDPKILKKRRVIR